MHRIKELDGIRTIAVVAVVASHIAPFRNFGMLGEFGRAGVDAFFVLSGYLITTVLFQLKAKPHRYRIFYARRFVRIIPPYALLLLLIYGGGALHHELFEPKKFVGQILFLRSFLYTNEIIHQARTSLHSDLLSLLFTRWTPSAEHDFGWLPISASLGPTWSLSVEEWFYVLWAPAVLILNRRRLGWFAASACLVGFLLRSLGASNANFFTCFDILATGALLALWMERRQVASPETVRTIDRFLNGAAFTFLPAYLVLAYLHRGSFNRTLFALGIAGLLAFLIRSDGGPNPISNALRFGPLVYTGVISYTFYLFHLPAYFVVRNLLNTPLSGFSTLVKEWTVGLTSVAAAWIFASLSWHYFESPILGYKDRFEAVILPRASADSNQTNPGLASP